MADLWLYYLKFMGVSFVVRLIGDSRITIPNGVRSLLKLSNGDYVASNIRLSDLDGSKKSYFNGR